MKSPHMSFLAARAKAKSTSPLLLPFIGIKSDCSFRILFRNDTEMVLIWNIFDSAVWEVRHQPVCAACRKSMNSGVVEGCEGNGDVVSLTQGDLGSSALCTEKRSEKGLIQLMKPSNSKSIKYIIESWVFPLLFLFSLLPLGFPYA